MASPDEVLDGIIRSVKDAGVMPDDADYLKYEADLTGENANLHLPLLQVQPVTVTYPDTFNTSRVSYILDENGNKTGRIYHSEYELAAELDIWVAAQSKWDVNKLGNDVRRLLYRHDSESLNIPLPNENYEYIIETSDGSRIRPDDVWRFSLDSAERVDDTTRSPTLRRWRYEFTINSYDIFETEESYIEEVTTPNP